MTLFLSVLTFFLTELGQSGVYFEGEGPIDEKCVVWVYYSQTPQSHKDCITKSFEGLSGHVRVVFASTSLMGVDFPNVKNVVHYLQTLIVYLLVNVIKNKQGKFQRMREHPLGSTKWSSKVIVFAIKIKVVWHGFDSTGIVGHRLYLMI